MLGSEGREIIVKRLFDGRRGLADFERTRKSRDFVKKAKKGGSQYPCSGDAYGFRRDALEQRALLNAAEDSHLGKVL